VCKADSAGPELLGQFGNQLAWIAISDDEVAARGLQSLTDFGDSGVNKGDPTILQQCWPSGTWQSGQDGAIKNKHQLQTFRMLKCGCNCGVVFKPKIPSKPHQCAGL